MAKRNLKFSGWNWSDTKTQFQKELIGLSEKVNNAALNILADAQKDFIKNLPSEETPSMPFITGNLHDSIVCVLSIGGGAVVKVSIAEPMARVPATEGGKKKYSPSTMGGGKKIYGHIEAVRAAYRSRQGRYPSGIAATMMVAVPYAENPNEISATNKSGKHAGYLDVLASKYYRNIERGFSLYDKYDMFRWKGGPLSWDTPILK